MTASTSEHAGPAQDSAAAQATGSMLTAWYGKVPARGDFVTRGFRPEWVAVWDEALQEMCRQMSRGSRAHDNLDPWARLQPWRFLAWGANGPQRPLMIGVLVASCDRVGRRFPLLVVQTATVELSSPSEWQHVEAGLDRLSDAALDVTDTADPRLTEDFVNVLASLPALFTHAPATPAHATGELNRATPGSAPPESEWTIEIEPCVASLWWQKPLPGEEPRRHRDAWPPCMEWLLEQRERGGNTNATDA